jgi:hypothetical protein
VDPAEVGGLRHVVSELIFLSVDFRQKRKEETVTLFTGKGETVGEILMTSSGIRSRVLMLYGDCCRVCSS